MKRWSLRSAVALTLALIAVSPASRVTSGAGQEGSPQELAAGLSPDALAQIDALIREKDSRTGTDRKIDSQLLYTLRMEMGQAVATGVSWLETDVPYAPDGHVVVDVKARLTPELNASLTALGIEVLSVAQDSGSMRLHIGLHQLVALAALRDVRFVQPKQEARTSRWRPPVVTTGGAARAAVARSLSTALGQEARPNVFFTQTGQGSRSSEGDITHLAHAARSAFSATGAGVKIGVLSDGVTNLAASQAAGDLGPVTVLAGQTGSGDEGTAMLEIIHDLAPAAQLYFATAFTSIASFADNIRALRAAGCDIIVDDVFYFVETPLQDGQAPGIISNTNGGVVTQAVNDVTAAGALYFSSAGNTGNLSALTSGTWEGDFADGGATGAPLPAGRVHNFGGQNFNVLEFASASGTNLYWSDPLGGSANDYDLFRLNATGTSVLASSTNLQTGTQDPYEQISGSGAVAGERIVIVKHAAAGNRFLHLGTLGGELTIATAGDISGHAAAANAFAVAATPAAGPFPQPFSASNMVEWFSSDGPRRVFYQPNGTPYTAGNVSATGGVLRQKPDITAADGVSVTGVGGFPSPFYGTSAAAPHAAAIAALLKSTSPGMTPAQMRTTLTASAIDIAALGMDRDSGAGIVMADAAMRAAGVPGTAFVDVVSIQATDNPGNGNGAPEAGEGAYLAIPLANYGAVPATAISATLTSATPGVSITQPSARGYPDLAVSASGLSSAPFFFTLASTFPCPQAAAFTLTVTFAGGPSPRVFNFQVPIGPPAYSITTTLDTIVAPGAAGVTTTTGTQSLRLNRNGIASTCGVQKATPPLFNGAGARRFDAYTFNTCSASVPSCVTVIVQSANAINLFSAGYAPAFNAGAVQQNYRADAGSSSSPMVYSFDLAGGAQSFAIDVHEATAGGGVSSQYTLKVAGACGGACAPPNQVPMAIAANVTVPAGPSGTASASINNGSSDPDGDPLTITQSPPGPYPVGQTSVLLTVTDTKGAASQATATVTVTGSTTMTVVSSINPSTTGQAAMFTATVTVPGSGPVTDGSVTFQEGSTVLAGPAPVSAGGMASFSTSTLPAGPHTITASYTSAGGIFGPSSGSVVQQVNAASGVTEAAVTAAVETGSARVHALQRADGGWFFKVGDTDCRAGAGVSCRNTVGITGLGLLAGYTRTANEASRAALMNGAKAAGDYLVAISNAGVAQGLRPASQDVEFLTELGTRSGVPLYTTTAQNWFQVVVNQYPNAADRVDAMIAGRQAQGVGSLAAWDIASFIRAAKAVGNLPYAQAAAVRVVAREADWKCPVPAGCGDPNNPRAFVYTLLGEGSLLWALHDLQGFVAQVTEYRSFLLAQQQASGAWIDDLQVTSYAVLGLAAAGGAGTPAAIESAVAFFLANRLPSNGWPFTPGGIDEYTEVDAEIVRAMFTLYNTPAGASVAVAPAQLSSLTFSAVTTSGLTSVVGATLSAKMAPGYEVLQSLAYDVATTASVSGATVACFRVPANTDAAAFASLRVLHAEDGAMVDRTVRAGPSAPDFAARRVCASVSALSGFAVAAFHDTTPPALAVTLAPPRLWPADRRMVTVTATIRVSDESDPAPVVRLVSIVSSEADAGLDKHDKAGDVAGALIGTDDRTFQLRAERSHRGPGRIYTVTYRATDSAGHTRDATAQVVVPRHRRR
jgi:hypothetical protein